MAGTASSHMSMSVIYLHRGGKGREGEIETLLNVLETILCIFTVWPYSTLFWICLCYARHQAVAGQFAVANIQCRKIDRQVDTLIIITSTLVNPTGVYPHMPIAVTAPFVTLTSNLSRSSKVKLMGPTS